MKRIVFLLLSGALFFSIVVFYRGIERAGISITRAEKDTDVPLFPYQCIDTMKVSRDKARLLPGSPKAQIIVRSQVQTIASLGANCIAIGTPYDEEFVPFMKMWVAEARRANLSVWFRGNWSAWEGWFGYPKGQTPEEHSKKTVQFITSHPELFADGDIFSANVEPENGAYFHPVDSEKKQKLLRDYLIQEQTSVKNAFSAIDKRVITSWISMSGGVAKVVLDEKTVTALNYTVTLDHYVKTPSGMTEYSNDFQKRLHPRIVFGEFGAPIPDIHGEMDDTEQAEFVEKLFMEMLLSQDFIDGVNYWTLSESSTALLNNDSLPKPVVEVVKKYYNPGLVELRVTGADGKPLAEITISDKKRTIQTKTDKNGKARLILPEGSYTIIFTAPTGETLQTKLTLKSKEQVIMNARFAKKTTLLLLLSNFLQKNSTTSF